MTNFLFKAFIESPNGYRSEIFEYVVFPRWTRRLAACSTIFSGLAEHYLIIAHRRWFGLSRGHGGRIPHITSMAVGIWRPTKWWSPCYCRLNITIPRCAVDTRIADLPSKYERSNKICLRCWKCPGLHKKLYPITATWWRSSRFFSNSVGRAETRMEGDRLNLRWLAHLNNHEKPWDPCSII